MNLDDRSTSDSRFQPQDEERVEDTSTQSDGQVLVGQAGEAVVVSRPAPGQTVEILAAADRTYVLDFPANVAQVRVEGDNFILGFDDNGDGTIDSQIVFLDLLTVAEGAGAPTFQIAGVDIGSELLISQAVAMAGGDDVPLDDVAEGPQALGSGATEYSDDFGELNAGLDREGVIPPTELQFGLIDLENEPIIPEDEESPPEADPVLTPASQPDGGEGGGLPTDLQDALADVGSPGAVIHSETVSVAGSGLPGSVQYIFFTLSEPTAVTITTDGPTIDPHMYLFRDDGSLDAADFLAVDDDDGLPAGSFSNAVIETGDEIGILPAGSYVIAVADYQLTQAEAIAGINDSSGLGERTGDVTVTIQESSPSVAFFKQLTIDGDIGDDDTGEVADFGGADAETALGDLTFTLLSPPTFGQLILVTSGGATSFLSPGDTFSSEDTVWWIATEDQIAEFLSIEGASEFLPNVEFDYSVTDEAGNVATAPVVITIPREVTPPEVALDLYGGDDCIEEDSSLSDLDNDVSVTVVPSGDDLLTEIVLSGFQSDWTYDLDGLDTDGGGGAVVVTDNIAGDGTVTITFSPGSNSSYHGSFSVQPPADSDVDHPTITATATVVDPADPSLTTSGDNSLDIHVDAIVDGSEVEQTAPAEGDEDSEIALNLQINLGSDSTTGPGESQGGTDTDGSESVTRIVVMLSLGTLGWVLPASVAEPSEGPDGTWTFDTSGASLEEVQALVASFNATPPEGFDGTIDVTVETTTAEAATEAGPNGDSGEECDESDNVDVDTYEFTVTVNPTVEPTPVLVVGENVNDVESAQMPHRIDDTSDDPVTGEIVGNDGGDVLIGDVGGGERVGKTLNLALVLDTSDSMDEEIPFGSETISRIEALDRAVEELLQNLADTPGATVRVHMISFASDVKSAATFNIIVDGVVDADALQAARDFVLDADDNPTQVASGNTNYEAGFKAALDWFSNDANTLDDPDFNQTIFISDGLPNRSYLGDGTTVVTAQGNAQTAVNHVLGQQPAQGAFPADTENEFQGLLGPFKGVPGTVDSVGINVNDPALAILEQVDEGDADSIADGEQLVDVLQNLTGVTELAAVGSDNIIGNGGDDLVFGDTVFTDDLKSLLSDSHPGNGLAPGSGWSVIEALVDDGLFGNVPSEVNANIMAFLRDSANQETYNLGGESLTAGGVGREGGHDGIDGGTGNDTIFGQEGNDTILGGDGDDVIIGGSGDDSMTGGDGSDTFRWTNATQDGEADTITDFVLGPGGDVIDLAGLLTGVPPGPDGADLDDYMSFSFDGTDTTITIDFDGAGGGSENSTITLQGVDVGAGSNEDIINTMLSNGNLTV